MRTFFVKQQDLIDPESVTRPTADQAKFAEVVLRKDLPLAAMDVAKAITQVNLGFAVLSEQLDELAGLVKGKVRKNFRPQKRVAKSAKKSDRILTSSIGAAFGKEHRRIFKQSLEKGATQTRRTTR